MQREAISSWPFAFISLANSTIRMAFFADNPITVSSPTQEVNVVLQTAHPGGEQRADHAKRHRSMTENRTD